MENRTFEPDYSGIKKRVVSGLIAEIVFAAICVPVSVWFYCADIYSQHQNLDNLLLAISGILMGHLLLSITCTITSFRRCIRSVSVSEKGMKVNDFEYGSGIDHDNLRGTGFNFSTGIAQLLVPSMGQDLIIISSDDSGKQIRRNFWTGPVSDSIAKELRRDLNSFLNEGIKVINERRFNVVRETVGSRPVTVKINKNKFKKDTIRFSIIIGVIIVILLAGAVVSISNIPLAVILTAGAGFLAAYWISILMKTRANIDSIVTELKLTDKTFTANGESYNLAELKAELICIGYSNQNSQGSFKFEEPKTKFESGLFLSLSDSSKSNRYWIGPQIDSEAAAVILLTKYAEKIAEEMA